MLKLTVELTAVVFVLGLRIDVVPSEAGSGSELQVFIAKGQ